MTRRFLITRGGVELPVVEAADAADLLDHLAAHVHLYDTAEMLAEQAWARREAVHGLVEVREVP